MSALSPRLALPEAFADLDGVLAEWAEIGEPSARYLARQSSSMATLRAFYDLVAPRLDAIMDHLDSFAMDTPLPPPEQRLYNIALMLPEVALAVELYGEPGVPHAGKPHVVTMEFGPG